jgi:glycosyltransferase involved in cell wall biosynthesis
MNPRKDLKGDDPVVILHAPFDEVVRRYKGTSHVIRAVETLQQEGLRVELRLIQNMSRTEAVKQYGQGDIFVEQLHLGSYGNTAIEAMAYGLPVISSHHPAHAHLVPDCPVVHADPLTLTDRLRELVQDQELRRKLGQKSYHFVRRFHSNKKIVDHLLKIYREDLGTSQTGPRNTIRASTSAYQ